MAVRRLPILVVFFLIATGCVRRNEADPVWFGHLTPRGLPDRRGEHARQGVTLAFEEARAEVKPGSRRRGIVLHVACPGEAEAIRAETTRLIAVNKVAALLAGPDPDATEWLIRSAEPFGIPVVVPCEQVSSPGASVVSLTVPPTERGRALARFAHGELQVKRTVILTDPRSPVAAAVAAGYRSGWPRSEGGQSEERTYQKDANRQDLVRGVLKDGPDAVVFAGSAADFLPLLAQIRSCGYDKPVMYAGEDEGVNSLVKSVPGEADFYLVTVFPGGERVNDGFVQSYQKRFHEGPDLFATQAYDAARLLLATLEKASSAQPERLLDPFNRWESFPTQTGQLRWTDREALRPLFVLRVKGGTAMVVQAVEIEE